MEQLSFEFKHVNHMMKVGDRHGKWTVVGETHKVSGKKRGKPRMRRHLIIRCDCGHGEDTVILQKMLLRRPTDTGCSKCVWDRIEKSKYWAEAKEKARIRREKNRTIREERARLRQEEMALKRQKEQEIFEETLREKKLKDIGDGYYQKKCQCGAFFNINLENKLQIHHSQHLSCNRCEKLDEELLEHWRHIKRMCEDENYRLKHNRPDPIYFNSLWSEDRFEFYYHVIDHLGEKPSKKHFITLIDRDGDYVEGNIRWMTATELLREINRTTGLEGSATHNSWIAIKRVGCVESWHTSFRRFLEDAGIKGEGEFYYRKNKNEPYGPDNFEWRYIEGGRTKDNKDYQGWYRRKHLRPWYMCEEWNNDYLQFLSDMGPRPEGAYLWRYDETQPASPTNAYWGFKKGNPIT